MWLCISLLERILAEIRPLCPVIRVVIEVVIRIVRNDYPLKPKHALNRSLSCLYLLAKARPDFTLFGHSAPPAGVAP